MLRSLPIVAAMLAAMFAAMFAFVSNLGADSQSLSKASKIQTIQEASYTMELHNAYASAVVVRYQGRKFLLSAAHPLLKDRALSAISTNGALDEPAILLHRRVLQNGRMVGRDSAAAEQVALSANFDLAILGCLRNNFLTESVNISTNGAAVGDRICVMSSRHGTSLGETFSCGVVSAIGRLLEEPGTGVTVVDQTDAGISNGSSGGGVFNEEGELVGIVIAQFEKEPGLGAYVPARVILEWLEIRIGSNSNWSGSSVPSVPATPFR